MLIGIKHKKAKLLPMKKAKLKVRCVIYDCDGVLFDSFEANTRLYNDLCGSAGRSPLKKDEMTYVHSHTVFEAIHFLFGRDNDLEKKALELLKKIDLREYIVYLKMEPNLLETLNLLKRRGILRVINTNRTTSMKHIMERFELWRYFDMVVTALDVEKPKPHPESIEKIIRSFGLNHDEVVFIGDSMIDRQTADSAGIPFIAYKNREIIRDILIEDHLELLNLVVNSEDY